MTRARWAATFVVLSLLFVCATIFMVGHVRETRPLFHNSFGLYKCNEFLPGWGCSPRPRSDDMAALMAIDMGRNILVVTQGHPDARWFPAVAHADDSEALFLCAVRGPAPGPRLVVGNDPNRLLVINAACERWTSELRHGEARSLFDALDLDGVHRFDQSIAEEFSIMVGADRSKEAARLRAHLGLGD